MAVPRQVDSADRRRLLRQRTPQPRNAKFIDIGAAMSGDREVLALNVDAEKWRIPPAYRQFAQQSAAGNVPHANRFVISRRAIPFCESDRGANVALANLMSIK